MEMGCGERHSALVVGLQPVALADHVARVDWTLLDAIPGERGGSQRVTPGELEHILAEVNTHMLPTTEKLPPVRTMAGGSVANTIRGLAVGFGISCAVVGACGNDEQGQMFMINMEMSGVSLSQLRIKKGPTGQCVCLVDAEGNRTMRPCLSDAVRLQANEMTVDDFRGSKWVVLNGYGFYGLDLVEKAASLAQKEGAFVSMDLASFEVVRNFRARLLDLLKSGLVDLCFANEDEARELMRGEPDTEPVAALEFLAKCCRTAVVMLGRKGCIARQGSEIVRVPAVEGAQVIDTTGAGDLFASGFLYGMIKGLTLAECCRIGCCTGGAVVHGLGGEARHEARQEGRDAGRMSRKRIDHDADEVGRSNGRRTRSGLAINWPTSIVIVSGAFIPRVLFGGWRYLFLRRRFLRCLRESSPASTYWDGVSAAGVVSTGAHGSGLSGRGSALHEYVVGMRMVVPASAAHGYAKVVTLGPVDEDFKAARLSLGVLGAISGITFALEPMFKRSLSFTLEDDVGLQDIIHDFLRDHEFGDAWWYPAHAKVLLGRVDRVPVDSVGDGFNRMAQLGQPTTVDDAELTAASLEAMERAEDAEAVCWWIKPLMALVFW